VTDVGSYTFLPWLRSGIANQLTAPTGAAPRAGVSVTVEVVATGLDGHQLALAPVTRPVEIYGPGDVVGIDPRAIIRTEPRPFVSDFEPNYLPAIEFYDEDFPWRYTPAPPDPATQRLQPWLALVVLREGEFGEATIPGRPLPAISVLPGAPLPSADELWAFVHVHVNRSLLPPGVDVTSDQMDAVLPRLRAVLAENPDLAYSRIVSPRRLADNAAYDAFLVPAFETGRLAGIGADPALSPDALHGAWDPYAGQTEAATLPYYHRFAFRTGVVSDFEYLVRLLRPRPVDPRVGVRDLDVGAPGAGLAPVPGEPLALGGALRVPDEALDDAAIAERDRRERWDEPYPQPFQVSLAALVNLADDYARSAADAANAASGLGGDVEDDPDPLIVPPLYGRWHAPAARLLTDAAGQPIAPARGWVQRLNLDPRDRVGAGFGTRVVQQGQEELMAAAWAQVGDVLEANRRLRAGQLLREVGGVWHRRNLAPILAAEPGRALALTAPVHARVLDREVTAAYRVRASSLPTAALSVRRACTDSAAVGSELARTR